MSAATDRDVTYIDPARCPFTAKLAEREIFWARAKKGRASLAECRNVLLAAKKDAGDELAYLKLVEDTLAEECEAYMDALARANAALRKLGQQPVVIPSMENTSRRSDGQDKEPEIADDSDKPTVFRQRAGDVVDETSIGGRSQASA